MSQHQWKKGDFAVRKGRLCEITHIDFSVDPPSVSVKMFESGNEVGTEFSKLVHAHPPKWTCDVCTFDNNVEEMNCVLCRQGQRTKQKYSEAINKAENIQHSSKNANNNARQNRNEPIRWKCSLCTFDNGMSKDTCQMCYTVRAHDAELIYPKGHKKKPENAQNQHKPNNRNNRNQPNDGDVRNNGNPNNGNRNNNNDEKVNENSHESNEHDNGNLNHGNNNNNKINGNDGNDDSNNDNEHNTDRENDSEESENNNKKKKSDSDDIGKEWTLVEKSELNSEEHTQHESEQTEDPYLELE